jgi:DNA repair protein RecN (Recombination protein N)
VLSELAVADLGVIDELSLVLAPGMTALTGETGAGKTLVVEAIELLVGGRADPAVVRPSAAEATVQGRFVTSDDEEVVLARVIPRQGRSRAYVDGRLATVGQLADWGSRLVDLHGQHAHQSLLSAASQRAALDRFAGVDLEPLESARHEVRRVDEALAALGGDDRARAREIDLLRFQVTELEAARLDDPDEDAALEAEEELLADAVAHREAAGHAAEALSAEGPAAEALAATLAALAGRAPFAGHVERLRSVAVEVADLAGEIRAVGERIEEDPERLADVRGRRQLLRELTRKYGDDLGEVIAYAGEATDRLARLEAHDEEAAALDVARRAALARVADEAAAVAKTRRAAAPELGRAVQGHLADLAMANARLAVEVGDEDPGDLITFLLAAHRGAPMLPLAKVASGGELARAMLALRLVLIGTGTGGRVTAEIGGPSTLVFDEVDAGIGGRAAQAVGSALAALAVDRQVLVVTHLPQVAAFADHQVAIHKHEDGAVTRASLSVVDGPDRVIELSRMLSGSPDSSTARRHAEELLAAVSAQRAR